MTKNKGLVLFLSALLLAAVLLSGCIDGVTNNATVTPSPTPSLTTSPTLSPTTSPAPSPTPSLTPSPTPTPEATQPSLTFTPEVTPPILVKKEIHQDLDTTPALAGLPEVSNITMEAIGFEVTLTDEVNYYTEGAGTPIVPCMIKEFKIPKESDVESVSVNLSNPVGIHNIFIRPQQPPVPGGEDWWRNITPPPYTIDNETYASREPYPGKEYKHVDYVSTDLDTHAIVKFVIVYIYPIQYIPAESRIIAYRNASVSLVYWASVEER